MIYNRGFSSPEIHGVTRIWATTVDLDGGAYVGLSFVQSEEFAVAPECQIFGGPEMAGKFERLAAAVNEIFGAPVAETTPEIEAPAMSEIPF
jgi:hypothetical protein